MNKQKSNGLAFYLIIIAIILGSAFFFQNNSRMNQDISLSQMFQDVDQGKVKSAVLNSTKLELQYKAAKQTVNGRSILVPGRVNSRNIHTMMIPEVYQRLSKAVEDKHLESLDYKQPVDVSSLFNLMLILLMLGGMGFFMWVTFNRTNGMEGKSAMNFGRSRAKLVNPKKNTTTFDDVAGAEEEKEELKEIVDFLKNPEKYTKLGAKVPRGILLVGAPGTGKTLLVRAVAGEAGVPFFTISGSEFMEMFVGVGASRVRDLFDEAKKRAPSIIFIDEIDAIGRHRGSGFGGGHDEREQTLNQLLVEMDGFEGNSGVIVMAATNRPDILDSALTRPGRFDRRITVMKPDQAGRKEILKVHARNKPLSPDVNLENIAKITPGFTGADLANLLNEAALTAASKSAPDISYQDIADAVFKVTVGPEKKSRIMSEKEKSLTAYHEAGHAIVLRYLSNRQKIERISIIPAGSAGGYTAQRPVDDQSFIGSNDLIVQIKHALGGRAAEELTQDDISTGAYSDLQSANAIAREMVTKYGMSKELGHFVFSDDDDPGFATAGYPAGPSYSQAYLSKADDAVSRIINEAYEATKQILQKNRKLLDELSKALMEKEKIEGPEFEEIYKAYAADYKPAPEGQFVLGGSESASQEETSRSSEKDSSSDDSSTKDSSTKASSSKDFSKKGSSSKDASSKDSSTDASSK